MESAHKTPGTLVNSTESSHQKRQSKDFAAIMSETTHDMPWSKRFLSRLIHTSVVAHTSDILGRTIARPNAILFGAVCSFTVVIGVYLLSKNFGYSLSGFESIIAFIAGWACGIGYDIFVSLFKRKK